MIAVLLFISSNKEACQSLTDNSRERFVTCTLGVSFNTDLCACDTQLSTFAASDRSQLGLTFYQGKQGPKGSNQEAFSSLEAPVPRWAQPQST